MVTSKKYHEAPGEDIVPEPVEVCPSCGANREALRDSLMEAPDWVSNGRGGHMFLESENHATARLIISNCPACEGALGDLIRPNSKCPFSEEPLECSKATCGDCSERCRALELVNERLMEAI